eukprot:scaffold63322_cov93-Phaeocystis_antarctica.AAC.1
MPARMAAASGAMPARMRLALQKKADLAAKQAPPRPVRTGGTDRSALSRSPGWARAALACACVGAAVLVWRGLRAR